MDITWLGHAAVRVRTRQAAIVMDPTDRSAGHDMGRPAGEIATISRVDHPQHSHVKGIKGEPVIVDGPGEYEILGVHIEGIRALWPVAAEAEDQTPEATTIYIGESEEMTFAHLGGLGQPPTGHQSEALGDVDILILPIALPGGLGPEAAAKIVRALEPRMVIPVGYEPPASGESAELKAFLEAVGDQPEEAISRLTVNRRTLGDKRRMVILESRG
ncbi:MAG: MBL fold metallo-hydrolase [Chloroflexi bacterium]|nr:MBL fold metallo-hydrolase [Chloroflexota bacterium]MDA1146772.1 MBL fold metallo-hydrolase [Chloroflexota bacterium]